MFRSRDQHHSGAVAWQDYLVRTGALITTTEAVCWEWMNAMSGVATRSIAAYGFERVRHDPRVELVPCSGELSAEAIRLFTARPDKDWSLTDCLSFIIMSRRNMRQALTADNHFVQAGFHAALLGAPPRL